MDFNQNIDLTGVLISCTVFLITFLLIKRWRTLSTFKRMGVPGPSPSFFFGNLKQLEKAKNRNKGMQEWVNKYGKTMGFYEGVLPVLLIMDLEMIKTVFIKDFNNFVDRPGPPVQMPEPYNKGLTHINGEDWKRVRHALTPAFSGKKLKQIVDLMHQSVEMLLEILKEKAKEGKEFDIFSLYQALTMQVFGESVFALKVECLRNPNDSFVKNAQNFFRQIGNRFELFGFLFPILGQIIYYFVFEFSLFGIGKPQKYLMGILKQVIQLRRKEPQANKRVDMLQLMIEASEASYSGDQTKTKLSDNELMANAFVFLLAGFETTANTLAYITYNLAKHLDVQKEVQKEVDKILEKQNPPDYYVLNEMPKLNNVISESLRLYPPVIMFTSRITRHECTVGDLIIPKGVKVLLPVWQVHHHKDYWPDPEKFDPDRFSSENKNEGQASAWFPFGTGPRNCIGMRFALLEIKLALSQILKKYTIVPGESFEDPLQLNVSPVLMSPKNGVFVKVIPRQKLNM